MAVFIIGMGFGAIIGIGLFALSLSGRTSLFWQLVTECDLLLRELQNNITPAITDPGIQRIEELLHEIDPERYGC